jgi:hypothetical protein
MNTLKPLKIEVKDFKLFINGLKELLRIMKVEEFMSYKSLCSIPAEGRIHLAVSNESGTSAQILTSSKTI